jgi:hypothetical protein
LRVARPLHHDRLVPPRLRTLGAAIALATGASGCFFNDAINERPSAEIRRLDTGVPQRGELLEFRAEMDDPDRDGVFPSWRFQACNGDATCASLATGTDPYFAFEIPSTVEGLPTTKVMVTLDVVDELGAIARPQQRLDLDVINNLPTLEIQPHGREIDGAFPPDVPIFVSARGDDDDNDAVELVWELFPPRNSVLTDRYFIRIEDPPNGGEEYELYPDVDGTWTVRVTVRDGIDETFVDLPILVVPDQPPCLGASDPSPVPGTTLLLDEPRRLSVLVVEDDLDVYPAPSSNDPFLGPTRFRWYVRGPGATTFALAATDVGGLELDPAQYDPGDLLDVRVEIDDRVGRSVQCADDMPTCSMNQDGCLQRQTWSLEVR